MNDAERRRAELLRQTRRLYNENEKIPAVHPRYGGVYHALYEDDGPKSAGGGFCLRLAVSILLFVCFVYMEQNNTAVAKVNAEVITEEIGDSNVPDFF